MNIRSATDLDEQKIKEFSPSEWPAVDAEHFGRVDVFFNKNVFKFIAEDSGQMAGYIIIETDMGVCTIDSIIIGHSYRGQGIGRALMRQAEDTAIAEGCHKLFLVTGVDWDARQFYESLGYREVVVLKNHYDGKDFVQMEKWL